MPKKDNNIKVENNKKTKKEDKNKRHFLKDFKAELKKVVWPTPKQLLNNTIAVITIVIVIGVVVFLLDMGFELLNNQNSKLQEKIQTNNSNTISNTIEDTNTTSNNDEASSAESNIEINNNAE